MSGKFDFITNKTARNHLEDGYETATRLGVWEKMKSDLFQYSKDSYRLTDNTKNCHSGSSGSWLIQELQYIARHGLEQYKELCLRVNEDK